MLRVQVGGQWLGGTVGPYGPVTVEYGLHGSESASWEMARNTCHPLLRGNAAVRVFDGGLPVWSGNLVEPGGDGSFSAQGSWHQAEGIPAAATSGALTTVPDDAIAGGVSRGDISWGYATSISAAAWSTANGELTLANLLDGYAAELGMRWVVEPNLLVYLRADPTVPMWHVPNAVAGRGLTPAEDEFATHLVSTHLISAGVFGSVTVGSADAAAVFGRRAFRVDLTALGFITNARATSILTGMFVRAGARMGWAEGLRLGRGQLVTPGGTVTPLDQVRSLQMIRLAGTLDTSRAYLLRSYTDVVIAKARYTDGSGFIDLDPVGYAPRTLTDVLDVSVVTP